MACGYVPFGFDAMVEGDPMKVYESVQKDPLEFPKDITNEAFIALVSMLLDKNPEKRVTLTATIIMAHDFFLDLDWSQLLQFTIPSPFIPKKRDSLANLGIESRRVPLKEALPVVNI